MAVFNGQPLVLSNDFNLGHNQPGGYRLKAYTPAGDLVWADSILWGSFPADYQHFALQPFCNRLLLQYPAAGGMAIKSYAADFSDSLLIQSSTGTFEGSFPFICTRGEYAVFGSNFRNAELHFGDGFTLSNDKSPDYQQFILYFDCASISSNSAPPLVATSWQLAPNPAIAAVYLYRQGNEPEQNIHLELFDAIGRLHWQGKVIPVRTAIPVETLPTGSYFLWVMEAREVVTLRGIRW